MPGGDRTGPMGQGPMSGRGAGYCAGNNQPGWTSAPMGGGRAWGGGQGGGRGWGRGARRFQGNAVPSWNQAAMAPEPPPPAVPGTTEGNSMEQKFNNLQKQVEGLSQSLEKIGLQLAQLAKNQ
ncbi:MAG: hypothetical protein EOM12_09275 [Verrucomicrobiae bacterium]|nr:hypothetical protein [Verrucomicrobiae bacterium]